MQPYPWSPDLVWPDHQHGAGCLSARAEGTGFPTVVRRLCFGPGCGLVWVLLTPPVLAGVLGGCVWARFVVLCLFCRLFVVFVVGLRFRPAYGMCVVACALCLLPAVSGAGVQCGRACWARVSAVPRPSWLVCRGVFFALFLLCLGFALWCWLLGVPVRGLVAAVPPSPFSRAGLLAFSFVVCVCMFRCPFSRWAAVPGLVLPVLAGWSPCASLGVLSSVPSGWGVWPPVVVLAGGFLAVGCFRAPPSPPLFFGGGGLPVPPSAFPGLAHALARIQIGLPSCCWRLRSVWPCSGPMGRVGYVHPGLGAPFCRVRSWLCRLGGCAKRLRVALGQGAGVVRVLSPLRCRFEPSGWSATVVAGHAVAPCVACGACVWRAGTAPSGVCGGLLRLVLQVRVSRAVLCRSVPRRVASCCGALLRGALWCGVPWSRVVPWWVSGGQPGLCRGAECGPECGWLVAGGCG